MGQLLFCCDRGYGKCSNILEIKNSYQTVQPQIRLLKKQSDRQTNNAGHDQKAQEASLIGLSSPTWPSLFTILTRFSHQVGGNQEEIV